MKALKGGLALTHLGAPEHCTQMRSKYIIASFRRIPMFLTFFSMVFNDVYLMLSDNIRFCLVAFWWRAKKMRRGPICTDGVNGSTGNVVAEVRCGAQRVS